MTEGALKGAFIDEERIRQLEDLAKIGELSAVIAHEIRNPLAGIQNTCEVLRDRLKDDVQNRELACIVLEEIERLSKIINDLLDFARVRKPYMESIDIGEGLARSLASIEGSAEMQGVDIYLCIGQGINIIADKDQIGQAFLNILINALDAMPEGGQLKLKTGIRPDKSVEIVFADTGKGMSKEEMERAFDPFFTTKTKGVGLGLSVTRKIIRSHGGEVVIRSGEGKGTEVIVRLPMTDVKEGI